jgi:hypothetical protein
MRNWKTIGAVIASVFFVGVGFGQVYQHNFGTTAISAHPYIIAPTILDPNLSGSSWSNSVGAWTSFAGSSGQAIALSNSSGTPVITLSFSVAPGCSLDLTSFSFWRQRSTSGAQNWSMAINGTSVASGSVPTAGANTGNIAITGQTGLTGVVTIQLSLSGASGTGTFRMDDFTLNGSTSCGVDPEPSNHPTDFTCLTTSTSEINLSWSDAIGAQLPDGYLIKWSTVSYAAISDPTDGSTANGANSVTVNYGVESVTIPGLTPTTQYFFKIFPYTNSGASIDYKIDGVIEQTDCTTDTGPCVEESFTNNTASGSSYTSGNYVGDAGLNWQYSEARSVNVTDNITGTSLGFNSSGNRFVSTTTSGGVGSITFSIRSYFTGGGAADRTMEVWVGGVLRGSFTLAAMGTVYTHTISNINVSGTTLVEFRSVGTRQIILDDVSWTCFTTSNTLVVNSISTAPFTVNCATATSASGTVNFSSTGTFDPANVYTVELSDASGSFADPTTIGTLTSNANSGAVSVNIPQDIQSGTDYLVRIISSNPYLVGDPLTASFVIIQEETCVGGLPNCSAPIWFEDFESYENGEANPASGKWSTNANNCDGEGNPGMIEGNYWGVYNGEFRVNDIEGVTCCSASEGANDNELLTEIIDITGQNELSLFVSSRVSGTVECASCGSGGDYFEAQYRIDEGTWTTFSTICGASSNFAQSDCIETLSGSTLQIRVLVGNQANDENYFFDDIYVCPVSCFLVLPISFGELLALNENAHVNLSWNTFSELNNDRFIVLHSTNGRNYSEIGQVTAAGNTTFTANYQFQHRFAPKGLNYYKLISRDYDGTTYNHKVVAVQVNRLSVVYDNLTGQIRFDEKGNYSIFSATGALVSKVSNSDFVSYSAKGYFIVRNEDTGQAEPLIIH